MAIRVKLFSTLVPLSKTKQPEFEMEPVAGLTVEQLIDLEGFTGRMSESVAASVNGVLAMRAQEIQDGDEVELLVNIQGG